MFIVEIQTTAERVCESYPTYEEARRRVELFPAAALVGMPLIFEELVDGSQRIVRDDGKPLQWHRVPEAEDAQPIPEEPLPLSADDGSFGGGKWVLLERPTPQDDGWDEEPLPLS